jgi:predicted Ser/Thr protein kinase
LEAKLNQHADRAGKDPLKALKRRLDKHEFTYLTNLSLEAQLLRRELTGETRVWEPESWDDLERRIQEPISIAVRDERGTVVEKDIAPHTIEAAALYAVISRLDTENIPAGLDVVEKALLFDRGYLMEGDEQVDIDEYGLETTDRDGSHGIPVTYVRDGIADLLHQQTDRHHPELPVEHVLMPDDVLTAISGGLRDAPVFSENEATDYAERAVAVKNHILEQQEKDVLSALMRDKRVDEATVEEYIEQVYAWASDDQIKNERGEYVEPDLLQMKVFEIEHLGRFDEKNYDGEEPDHAVEEFRTDKIITALNRHAWQRRDERFRVSDVSPMEIPVIESILGSNDWDDVERTYPDLDPRQWDSPPANTQTARLKEATIENMIDMYSYSEAAAELTSRRVMEQVNYQWG